MARRSSHRDRSSKAALTVATLVVLAALACTTGTSITGSQTDEARPLVTALPGQLTAAVVSIVTAGPDASSATRSGPGADASATAANLPPTITPIPTRRPASVLDALIPPGVVNGELISQTINWTDGSLSSQLRFTTAELGLVYVDQALRLAAEPLTAAVLPTGRAPLADAPSFGDGSVVYADDVGLIRVAFYVDRLATTLVFRSGEGRDLPADALLPLAQLVADRVPAQLEMPPSPEPGELAPSGLVGAVFKLAQPGGLVDPAGTTFGPADALQVLVAAPDAVEGLGYLLWSIDGGQYVELQAAFQARPGGQQPFSLASRPPGDYRVDVVTFAGQDVLSFVVVQSLPLTFAS